MGHQGITGPAARQMQWPEPGPHWACPMLKHQEDPAPRSCGWADGRAVSPGVRSGMIMVMPSSTGATVHLLAGLNGAGKSTHARRLEQECPAVRFTLDEWMLRLHQLSYDDPRYPELSQRCKHLIWEVAAQVLATGTDVVLDWNLWSRQRRKTWRDKVVAAGHHPVLHYVSVPVETAIGQVTLRLVEG